MEKQTVNIINIRLEAYEARLELLKQAANRIGAHFEWVVRREDAFTEERAIYPERPRYKTLVRMIPVDLEFEELHIGGWTIDAKIEHKESGNMVKVFPDREVNPEWRLVDSNCDHCGTNRRRLITYVLRHRETGETRQVGTTCLGDFLGHPNPDALENWYNCLELIQPGDEDLGREYGSGHFGYRVEDVLAITHFLSEKYGFVSKSAARYNERLTPTSFRIVDVIRPRSEMEKDDAREFESKSAYHFEKAREILAHVIGIAEATDVLERSGYIHNLYTAVTDEMVEWKDLGLVASAVSVWNRDLEKKAREEAEATQITQGHFGTVGERVVVRLQHLKTYAFPGFKWDTYINKFRTEDGLVLVWRSSTYDFSDEIGNWFEGKATIKAHENYRGQDQTMITRCKLEAVEVEAD